MTKQLEKEIERLINEYDLCCSVDDFENKGKIILILSS